MCFLDKVCIDQENEARKSAGIASLGAFLGSSDNFVVLYSPEYFVSCSNSSRTSSSCPRSRTLTTAHAPYHSHPDGHTSHAMQTRLWTLYELAAFCQIKDPDRQRLVFLPLGFARVVPT